MFGLTFWLVVLVMGIVGAVVACALAEVRIIRDGEPRYYVVVALVALALVCGLVGSVVHADDGTKGECRQRGGVPTQTGKGWFCAAPGAVR